MKKPRASNGWGIVDPSGYLWMNIEGTRADAQQMAGEHALETWRRLYRQGYRCIRVTLIPSDATMMDALAGITGADA